MSPYGSANGARDYLEFVAVALGDQQFAIDIMSVREIRGWTTSTPLPKSPDFVRGMINLRGVILPVLDLRARLGLGTSEVGASSVVVVVQVAGREAGLLVDAVCDILQVDETAIQPTPDVGSPEAREFVRGLVTTGDGICSLLRLDSLAPSPAEAA